MNYKETIEYLYALQPPFHLVGAAAYKPGLQNTELLMEHLGHPEQRFKSIHITGTNGKGSVSHLIAASLQAAGLKVGLYTSPHLVDFRERVRVGRGKTERMNEIEESRVVEFVEKNKDFLEKVKPSFFETTMALAFQYFAEKEVDVAVVEVGLGGRLDSTNILPPYSVSPIPHGVILSVITNVGMDHTEFLGSTLSRIAYEKAGIMKPNVPCVVGEVENETEPVFIEAAKRNGIYGEGLETDDCKIWFAERCMYLMRERHRVVSECELKGMYQEKNMQTAFVALRSLNTSNILPNIPSEAIAYGFKKVCSLTGLRGRWETLSNQPLVICDTGHNSHGLKYVSQQLRQTCSEYARKYTNSRLRIVFGMVDDKDVENVIRLMPTNAKYYFTQAGTHRAIPAERLFEMWKQIAPQTDGAIYHSVTEAVKAAMSEQKEHDILFIGGSNYVIGELLKMWNEK